MKNLFFIVSVLLCSTLSAQWKRKDYTNILRSNNIYEINAFLRDAHPDDPRRSVLKPKVMKMMDEYIKTASPLDQRVKQVQEMLAMLKTKGTTKITFDEMNEIIRQKQIAKLREQLAKMGNVTNQNVQTNQYQWKPNPNAVISNEDGTVNTSGTYVDPELAEFEMLMNTNPIEHKNKTVQILNSLFDNDPNSKDVIVMIENASDCNIIVRMEGVGNDKYRLAVPSKQEGSIVIKKGNYLFTSLVCGATYASQKTVQKALMVTLSNPITK